MRSPWIEIAVNAISDKKGHNTLIIDVGDVLGISDNFVRLSVGIEDSEDLIEDLQNALVEAGI